MTAMPERELLRTAFALALGACVALGLARFSYAMLLPPMRADLGWSYATSGAMNTVNAAGYLVGALSLRRALLHFDARLVLLVGAYSAAVILAGHGLARSDGALYTLRFAAGAASAATFVAGGLLAARLGLVPGAKPALILGLYYGGTGLGIAGSAFIVPPLPWPSAWQALALVALAATAAMQTGTRALKGSPVSQPTLGARFRPADFAFGLASYAMFGLGYIGYMTFIVTLLREQSVAPSVVIAFYALLSVGVIASSWLWAPLLQRFRGGQPLAILNSLLAVATVLPVLSSHPLVVFTSGALFGSVFLSVVASTTALVRHNLSPRSWPAGIAAFTIVFALGQIVGPALVGWVADGEGGLALGLALSACCLAAGAVLGLGQRPLPSSHATT